MCIVQQIVTRAVSLMVRCCSIIITKLSVAFYIHNPLLCISLSSVDILSIRCLFISITNCIIHSSSWHFNHALLPLCQHVQKTEEAIHVNGSIKAKKKNQSEEINEIKEATRCTNESQYNHILGSTAAKRSLKPKVKTTKTKIIDDISPQKHYAEPSISFHSPTRDTCSYDPSPIEAHRLPCSSLTPAP